MTYWRRKKKLFSIWCRKNRF